MIAVQFKVDHPLWGFTRPLEQWQRDLSQAEPRPLDEQRVGAMLMQLATQARLMSGVARAAYGLGLIKMTREGEGVSTSVTFVSKYDRNMLALLVERGGVEPPEWAEMAFEEISAGLRVQGALAERGKKR